MTCCPCGTLAWRLWDESRGAFEARLTAYRWTRHGDVWHCPHCPEETHAAPVSSPAQVSVQVSVSVPVTTLTTPKPPTSPATATAACAAGVATTERTPT